MVLHVRLTGWDLAGTMIVGLAYLGEVSYKRADVAAQICAPAADAFGGSPCACLCR